MSHELNYKMVVLRFPEQQLVKMDAQAKKEHRTRSDFIREAVRRHMSPEAPVLRLPPPPA